MSDSLPAPADVRAPTVRSRLVALDVVRTAAILGMIAVHLGGPNIHHPTGPWQALHLASGFAAGTFAAAAGVALSLTNPARTTRQTGQDVRGPRAWLPTMVRGIALFALGLLVEPLSGGVLVILCVYGALFVVAAPLRGLPARVLAGLGLALLVAWPVASLAIRRQLSSSPDLELSWYMIGRPGWELGMLRTLFLDGTYPVPTWMALVLLAWAAHRAGLLEPGRRRAQATVSAALVVVGFGGAALVEAIWHPRRQLVSDLIANGWSSTAAEVGADHALGVPNAQIWPSLLTAGHHTGTWFELLQILAVAMTTYTLAGVLWTAVPAVATVASWPGRVSLSIYVGHLAVLSGTGWFWLGPGGLAGDAQSVAVTAMPAFWAVMVFWASAFGFGALFRRTRGPIEALLRRLAASARG